jgi:hypothetical protein
VPAGSSACTFEASWGCKEIFCAIGFSGVDDFGGDVMLVELLADELETVVVPVGLVGLLEGVGLAFVCGTGVCGVAATGLP